MASVDAEKDSQGMQKNHHKADEKQEHAPQTTQNKDDKSKDRNSKQKNKKDKKDKHKHRLRLKRKKDKDEGGDDDSNEDEDVEEETIEEAFAKHKSSENGLDSSEVATRIEHYGKNVLEEEHQSPIQKFLSYFWNPLAWAMEVGAIVSLFVFDWLDFGLIIALLIVNATIGYWEEAKAGSAIAALKEQLAAKAWVRRGGGDFVEIDAEGLVPGDVVSLASGNVCPADCKLFGEEKIKVDQSVLTGESLPVTKKPGDPIYSGSTIKQGSSVALVYATGKNTYFGRSAGLVSQTHTEGHYKQLLSAFGWFCSAFILLFVFLEIITEFVIRGKRCHRFSIEGHYCPTIGNLVVLIVGGVPIAMPTVLSVTMAIGAGMLAKKGAIVSRLTSVEDLAAMDVLCTDKTGTLTKNILEMGDPYCVGKCSTEQLILDACLCSDYTSSTLDPIDKAILEYQNNPDELKKYKITEFVPFDPTSKRTLAHVKGDDGACFIVAKGAPQVILEKATNRAEIEEDVNAKILELASRGYRALGVGRLDGDEGNEEKWEMEGIIALFDPPRDDTADTIHKAMAMGITVKMLTGDQQAIAAETARRLGMGTRIMQAKQFDHMNDTEFAHEIITHDGFAQVRPEHKYNIVKILQSRKHVVAMTGDGVNDAPALKKANVGFAVAGATEAARSASDIVMTEPGLSVMVDAIKQSRKIFERMKDYSTYTISVTVRVVLTFSILTFAYEWYFPTILVLIIAILNDGTIMTISRDRVKASPLPDRWLFREIFLQAFLLGLWQVISTVVFFVIIKETNFFTDKIGLHHLSNDKLRALIYLQVSISGQATIFVTRTRNWSFLDRPATPVICAFVLAQVIATFLGVYGFGGYPHDGHVTSVVGCGWAWALCAWIWVIIWHPWMDMIKFWTNSWLFKRNVPFIHPYSELDRRRDAMLEKKSKQGNRPRRNGSGDEETGGDDFEKEQEAIDEEEERQGQLEGQEGDENLSKKEKIVGMFKHKNHDKEKKSKYNYDDDSYNEDESVPKAGRWQQVWLGPTQGWYKVWVPDCYGKPVGEPVPVPASEGYEPPLTNVTYPSNNEDEMRVPPSYVRTPDSAVPALQE